MPDNLVDSIVTDPPYGLSFMGKKWDYDVPSEDVWRECLRVLKPGGHLLAFAGTRTQHRMAVRIEDAGFEIRDMIAWMYGSGFPKSLAVGKAIDKAMGCERESRTTSSSETSKAANMRANRKCDECGKWTFSPDPCSCPRDNGPQTQEGARYDGWGTALKPALEPITVARKPLVGTVATNVLEHGTGGINVDRCRVGTEIITQRLATVEGGKAIGAKAVGVKQKATGETTTTIGKWPANLIHDGSDEVVGLFPVTKPSRSQDEPKGTRPGGFGNVGHTSGSNRPNGTQHDDNGGSAARFFYCAKASKKDRDEGLDSMKLVVLKLHSCESNSTQQDQSATLLVNMEASLLKATEEFGTNLKNGSEWSTTLFGNRFTEQFQKECKSTTSTETRLTIESKILNALQHSITSDCTLVANSEMESGGNLAANVELLNTLTFTINEKMALALGASNVQSTMQLKISVKNGRNVHSTVKPTALMRYLCRLVTPPGGIVLDPFMRSGSTGKAAVLEGFEFIGIERDAEYLEIAKARINQYGQEVQQGNH
jgi:DNA modification methylase